MPGVIVPRKTVGELRRLLDDADGAIEVSLSDTKIQFAFDGVELTSKLIDGTFPDYERVIPSGNDKVAGDGVQGVRPGGGPRLDHLGRQDARGEDGAGQGQGDVVGGQSGMRHGDRRLGATYSAAPLEIGFNARYLLDITGQIEGKSVRLLLSDAGSPTLIEDTDDPRTLYVLMPMRV